METNALPNFGIYWAGWRTTILDLSKAGWTIHLDRDLSKMTYSIAIQNHLLKVVGLCSNITDEFLRRFEYNPDTVRGLKFEDNLNFPTLQMQYLSFKIAINIAAQTHYHFNTVDTVSVYPNHALSLNDILFTPNYKQATETGIVVPEYTIPELMSLIKERQAPRQKEIRERLRKETNPSIIKEEIKIITLNEDISNETSNYRSI